ncbi:L,D-transpeptidase family protein [Sulfobacillus thermosulfidooxidans]|uniref:L,D-transpeptidase family protein n=1 Tax=Sulfobacillus thermosulfidooxidans TaxID=28034 RepID=UPI0006B5B4F8|nr:L,D-transpeptidase family protein [Sulfobacillus thermosulfidooxidans]
MKAEGRSSLSWPWFLILTGILLVGIYGGLIWSMPHRAVNAAAAKVPTKIVINVVQRKLYLYRNNKLFHVYPVAVGKPETPSPRGEFVVTQKAIWGDGFGTRWIRFSAPWGIYGIHGTNKPWSVGTVASHGCFRMYNHDVEQVYALISLGTPVIVEGITPYVKIRRTINPGQIGQDVVELQRLLRLAKVYSGPLNGVYTPEVKQAVERFQVMVHLPITGVASLETTQKLLDYTNQAGQKPGYLSRD